MIKDEDIINFIDSIDGMVPKQPSEITFKTFGEVAVYGSKEGYLRLAIDFLKCAFPEKYDKHTEIDFSYLDKNDSDISIEWVTHTRKELDEISG